MNEHGDHGGIDCTDEEDPMKRLKREILAEASREDHPEQSRPGYWDDPCIEHAGKHGGRKVLRRDCSACNSFGGI